MEAELAELKFVDSSIQGSPAEKQPFLILCWLNDLYEVLRRNEVGFDTDTQICQRAVVKDIELLVDHIERSKEPIASKSIRDRIGSVYKLLYPKNSHSTSPLFESINKYVSTITSTRNNEVKQLSVVALGSIYATAGNRSVSLAPLCTMTILKLVKSATSQSGLKSCALLALDNVVQTAGDTLEPKVSKDIYKVCLSNMQDKSIKVAIAACSVVEHLVQQQFIFKGQSDFESFKSVCLKCLGNSSTSLRLAAAKCLAAILWQLEKITKLKSEEIAFAAESKRKSKEDFEEDEADRSTSVSSKRSSMSHQSQQVPKKMTYFALSLPGSLDLLINTYTKASTTSRLRTGLTQVVTYLLTMLDEKALEVQYLLIAQKLLVDMLCHATLRTSPQRQLTARRHVYFVLHEVVAKGTLGELGQVTVARILVNEFLGNNKTMEPTFLASLECLDGLLECLGPAISPIEESIKLNILKLMNNPSRSVRTSVCTFMRRYADIFPACIIPLMTHALNCINKEMSIISKNPSASHNLVISHAYLTAILIGVAQKHPQYTSLDLTSRIFTTAIDFLKGSGNVSYVSTQVQVGWIMIGGLMALGPAFVKVHFSQLFLLWKSALHKVSKDQIDKNMLELNYLLHVRHYALASIVSFISHNGSLITTDVARKLSVMLQNCFSLVCSLPAKLLTDKEAPAHLIDPLMSLQDYKTSVMRRVFLGYLYLYKCNHMHDVPAQLLTSALSLFADPDRYQEHKLSTSIATSSGAVDKLWDLEDNIAFGLTSKLVPYGVDDTFLMGKSGTTDVHWLNERSWLDDLEQESTTPIMGSADFDPEMLLYTGSEDAQSSFKTHSLPQSVPLISSLVDTSLELFVVLLPLQTAKVQESVLDQMQSYAYSGSSNNSPTNTGVSRKHAVLLNSVVAIYETLKVAGLSSGPGSLSRDVFKNARVLNSFFAILKESLNINDVYVRPIIGQSMGLLCSIAPSSMAGEIIKYLIDKIVENRDPNVRANCSVSLGYILKYVAGMFAGLHMKTVLGILISLANDPHPTVHFWALDSISIVIQNTGLSFASYASSTLSTLVKLYLTESHQDEMSSAASSNLDVEHPTSKAIVRCISAVVNVLGPDIQESPKNLSIILAVLNPLLQSPQEGLAVEATKSMLELIIFAPSKIDVRYIIESLHSAIVEKQTSSPLRQAAIEGLYQLLRTQSSLLLNILSPKFSTDIWLAYDATPESDALYKFFETWLEDTGLSHPFEWINRVQAVLWQSKDSFGGKHDKSTNAVDSKLQIQDEEGQSFTAGSIEGDTQSSAASNETLKWQTKALSVQLLNRLLVMHLRGKSLRERQSSLLVRRVGDIIKIAFTASTSSALQLRLLGLKLLNEALVDFGDIPDPDFTEVALLEQYQAQISSALTPAFSADSSPELAFHAVRASAAFIGSGIIKIIDRMGRILKLLTSALESCGHGSMSIVLGDLHIDSPNAQVMLRLAILSLWAELQVSSVNPGQEYLLEVVKPHVPVLIPLWISALSDFARLRFEPESSVQQQSSSSPSSSIDQMYTAFSRDSILPTYQDSWLQLVDAVASLVEKDREQVFAILGERDKLASQNEDGIIHYSNEPAAFFFVLFGLCFEALIRPQQSLGISAPSKRARVLVALKRILHRTVSGLAIYKDEIFAETVDILERIVLNGDIHEQRAIVDIVYNLCIYHPSTVNSGSGSSTNVSPSGSGNSTPSLGGENEITESVDQLFELFRIVTLALANFLQFLSDDTEISNVKGAADSVSEEAKQEFVRSALACLVSMTEVFPRIIKLDLYTCMLYIFERLFDEAPEIAANSLASHKLLVQGMVKSYSDDADAVGDALCTAFSQNVALLRQTNATLTMKRRNLIVSASVLFATCKSILEHEVFSVALFAESLVEAISNPELSEMAAECLKQLIVVSGKSVIGKVLVENALPSLISLASAEAISSELKLLPKLINDILVAFTIAQRSTEDILLMLGISVPLLLSFAESKTSSINEEGRRRYASQKLILLAGHNSEAFKAIVHAGLDNRQREFLEAILRVNNPGNMNDELEQEAKTHIQLKAL